MPEGRRRFTIAHEFGHAVFEQTGPNCPRHGVELEKICDMLASEFLMPSEVFRTRLNLSIHPTEIFRLAREFGTSIAATSVRCTQLLGVSVFQVNDAEFEWGFGAIRRKSDLNSYRDALFASRSMPQCPGQMAKSVSIYDAVIKGCNGLALKGSVERVICHAALQSPRC